MVEPRFEFECIEIIDFINYAKTMAQMNYKVNYFMVQNGVLLSHKKNKELLQMIINEENVTLWVDKFSMESRMLDSDMLIKEVKTAGMKEFVKIFTSPMCKTIWHSSN
jgi:predicted peroxiredoxin